MNKTQLSLVSIGFLLGFTFSLAFAVLIDPFNVGRDQGVMLCKMELPECEYRFQKQQLRKQLTELNKKL